MANERISCVYRGNTFYCDYDTIGTGADREVRVRYHDDELTARTNGRPDATVAESLLQELVVLENIALTVAEGAVPGQSIPRGDARDRRAA